MTNYTTPIQRLQVVREGSLKSRPRITSTATAKKFVQRFYDERGSDREEFACVYLSTKYQPLHIEVVSRGTLDAALVHPREIFKGAILAGASAILLTHNHPSGDSTPSLQDYDVTTRLTDAGKIIGITVLDHIVVGDDDTTSIRETPQKC